tara:strand:+ start:196 stop:903 length:708 start_codon:yes stop_codon:yes gene_type:complete
MTLDEIAFNIKNIVEGGIHGTDSNISTRQIKGMIHYHRAQLLTKYTDSGRYLSEKLYSYKREAITDGYIDLPEMVGFPNNRALVSVMLEGVSGGANLSDATIVPVFTEEDAQFHLQSRFSPVNNQIYGVIDGSQSRINFFFNEGITEYEDANAIVSIKYIASKPEDGKMGYPLPDELVATLVETVLSKEFNVMLTVGKDYTNNSVDDNIQGARISFSPPSAKPSANARSRRARTR